MSFRVPNLFENFSSTEYVRSSDLFEGHSWIDLRECNFTCVDIFGETNPVYTIKNLTTKTSLTVTKDWFNPENGRKITWHQLELFV